MQQFRAGFDAEFATVALSAARCGTQIVLPNRTPLPATREAGLVQIAESLNETANAVLGNRSRFHRLSTNRAPFPQKYR